ncbi:cytochrome o ubiquinol oxidase subunit IV [Asticcacaulis sp. EMRT-3]|uniref:cytochrome o ubiquinol oxidase subunit IV n=1 Tax=Asticcacaulis sp. EMRT-3 TaxID=3040349 RepID=UPI0024AEF3CC|nr:cytochrome o ubiquinol oxidase subunit IV [Asticcacaulis sp. EMRT-3]MDI7773915.1 cytochrome o ubiquinol oxidase subunit IV [Asticcacaulis sp. EMRT-3]
MSTPAKHDSHAKAHGHDDDDHGGAGHGSVGSYLFGFVASVVLTAIPFAMTMMHVLPAHSLVPVIVGIAVVQIIVHLIYFLHMNTSSSQGWNNVVFLFTLVIVCILIGGSLWVMYHMNANMMPGMMMPSASIG